MYLDIILITVIAFRTITGLKKGLIIESFSLAGIFISLFLTKMTINKIYSSLLDPSNLGSIAVIKDSYVSYNVVFILTFLIFYAVTYLLAIVISKLLKKLMLGWANAIGGGIFGFAKGLIISLFVIVILSFLSVFDKRVNRLMDTSYSAKLLPFVSSKVLKLFPDNIKAVINENEKNIRVNAFLEKLIEENALNLGNINAYKKSAEQPIEETNPETKIDANTASEQLQPQLEQNKKLAAVTAKQERKTVTKPKIVAKKEQKINAKSVTRVRKTEIKKDNVKAKQRAKLRKIGTKDNDNKKIGFN